MAIAAWHESSEFIRTRPVDAERYRVPHVLKEVLVELAVQNGYGGGHDVNYK